MLTTATGKNPDDILRDEILQQTRELAKLRFYYLIVTREALGLRRHQKVEEMYRIPPIKKYLQQGYRDNGQIQKTADQDG